MSDNYIGQPPAPVPPLAYLTQAAADARYVQQANFNALGDARYPTKLYFNKIINGGFAVDQRNNGAVVSAHGAFGPDRWLLLKSSAGAGVWTIKREVDSTDSGYQLNTKVGTVQASMGAADFFVLQHRIETMNIQDLVFGTPSAKPFVFAFEVASNVVGTYPISFSGANRVYVTSFTINAINTVETKTILVPGDTGGTWWSLAQDAIGMVVQIGIGVGSNYIAATPNVWMAVGSPVQMTVAGASNFLANGVGTQLNFSNVRMWRGTVDFGMGQRMVPEELALCQRYFQKTYPLDVVPGVTSFVGRRYQPFQSLPGPTQVAGFWDFRVEMRAVPTIVPYAPSNGAANSVDFNNVATAGATSDNPSTSGSNVLGNGVAGNTSMSWHATASAEL